MTGHIKHFIIFICVGLFLITLGTPAATAGIDVLLVMDSSGSMKKTDPKYLRIPAAKLFISLLNSDDRAGIISFSDGGYSLINLTYIDSEEKKRSLLDAADRITSTGMFTNLHAALQSAGEQLIGSKDDTREKIIILMSDGVMDVGDPEEDNKLLDSIDADLSVQLEDNNIKVYTVAFTDQSDTILLQRVAKRTGGFYNLARSDKDLHVIFSSIFESLKAPDMLPMSKNSFTIDDSVNEVTIVATKISPDTIIKIGAPNGEKYSHTTELTGTDWFVSDTFDMITITRPVSGTWEIFFSTEKNNKAYIITDLKLGTNFDQLYSTFGEPLNIELWLEKEGQKITEKTILDTLEVRIELTSPNGNLQKLKPFHKDGGVYVRRIAPFTPGNYQMKIVVDGKTFAREKVFVFNVADTKESKEDIKHASEKAKKNKEAEARKKASEQEPDIEIEWSDILKQFLIINAGLGVIILLIMNRKRLVTLLGKSKKKKEPDSVDISFESPHEDEDEEEEDDDESVAHAEIDDILPDDDEPLVPEELEGSLPDEEEIYAEESKPASKPQADQDESDNDTASEIPLEQMDDDEETEEEPVAETPPSPDESILSQDDLDAILSGEPEAAPDDENEENEKEEQEAIVSQDDLDAVLAGITPEDYASDSDDAKASDEPSSGGQDELDSLLAAQGIILDDEAEVTDDDWGAALAEQKDASEPEPEKDSEVTDDDWGAALAEQKDASEPEPEKDSEVTDDDWGAALAEQKDASEPKPAKDKDLAQNDKGKEEK